MALVSFILDFYFLNIVSILDWSLQVSCKVYILDFISRRNKQIGGTQAQPHNRFQVCILGTFYGTYSTSTEIDQYAITTAIPIAGSFVINAT